MSVSIPRHQVLQIIPQTMFQVLHQIIHILTHRMREVPTRLEKDKMKEFAQLDERYEVIVLQLFLLSSSQL